jgi:excinuclease ABC subunit A
LIVEERIVLPDAPGGIDGRVLHREIRVENARTHNLCGISCAIPLRALTVITGVSGSGKSSLAFDTLYAEGQRRYVTSLSTYARQFLERMPRPAVDSISHLPPAIAIEQRNPVPTASAWSTRGSPRSSPKRVCRDAAVNA